MNALDKMVNDTKKALKEYEEEKKAIEKLRLEISEKEIQLMKMGKGSEYNEGLATQDMGFYDIGSYMVNHDCGKCKSVLDKGVCRSCSFFYYSKYEVVDE